MIEVRNLSYRYPGGSSEALADIHLSIAEGRFVAVMGSNGSGKSTLAGCLTGLLRPSGGTVTVDGIPADGDANMREIRRRVGLIFQDPNMQMTSSTVERELAFGLQNLAVATPSIRTRVDDHIARFHLEQFRHSSPVELSGGEKQRVAIASVMLLEPRYLIVDEATSLLSGISRKEVLRLVCRLREERNISIILITQFPQEAQLADTLIVLHKGRIFFDAPPSEVFIHSKELSDIGVFVPLRSRVHHLL